MRHERSSRISIDIHETRIREHHELLENTGTYQDILTAVQDEPGIPRPNLARDLGLDTATTTRLVDHLEAAGKVETMKTGARIGVWPAGRPDGPASHERRSIGWTFQADETVRQLNETAMDPLMRAEEAIDPAQAATALERLHALLDDALADTAADAAAKPTVLDFLVHPFSAGLHLHPGRLAYLDLDRRVMAAWGHIGPGDAARFLVEVTEAAAKPGKGPSTKAAAWRAATPRHTHLERLATTYTWPGTGYVSPAWLLREVPAPTPDSVPATVILGTKPVTDPDAARAKQTACWHGPPERLLSPRYRPVGRVRKGVVST